MTVYTYGYGLSQKAHISPLSYKISRTYHNIIWSFLIFILLITANEIKLYILVVS